jgi:hypothetical protein
MKDTPIFAQHTGIWEGTYTRIDAQGQVIDQHRSRLTLRIEGNTWRQTNEYTWPDGRREFHDFGASPIDQDGVLYYDNPRIVGKAWETGDTICLEWQYKQQPGTQLYEIINLLGDGHRMRTWQHSRNGHFEGLTMIEERRVAKQAEI